MKKNKITEQGFICSFPGDPTGVPPGQYFGVTVFTVYPRSRGHIHITGPDPDDPADFYTGFFSDKNSVDLKKHRWTYKKQRELVRRMGVFRGEYQGFHPAFTAESKAAISEEKLEGPLMDIKDIEYSAEDDAVIDKFSRENVGSTWHSLGTCKMGPREKNGVVDADLNVYGVEGLKLADLSIAPKNVAANTGNTAMVIGEKAADIIIKELGLGR
jgi:alcohol oxidase